VDADGIGFHVALSDDEQVWTFICSAHLVLPLILSEEKSDVTRTSCACSSFTISAA
jgi:hypothetical protein